MSSPSRGLRQSAEKLLLLLFLLVGSAAAAEGLLLLTAHTRAALKQPLLLRDWLNVQSMGFTAASTQGCHIRRNTLLLSLYLVLKCRDSTAASNVTQLVFLLLSS